MKDNTYLIGIIIIESIIVLGYLLADNRFPPTPDIWIVNLFRI